MKVSTLAAAFAATGALALGSIAFAQEEKKAEPAAKPQTSHEHKGGHAQHGARGMHGARDMQGMRGGCHNQS
jgi:hypothetical protein